MNAADLRKGVTQIDTIKHCLVELSYSFHETGNVNFGRQLENFTSELDRAARNILHAVDINPNDKELNF